MAKPASEDASGRWGGDVLGWGLAPRGNPLTEKIYLGKPGTT